MDKIFNNCEGSEAKKFFKDASGLNNPISIRGDKFMLEFGSMHIGMIPISANSIPTEESVNIM